MNGIYKTKHRWNAHKNWIFAKNHYSSQVCRLTIRKFLYIYTEIKHIIKWIAIVGSSLLLAGIESYKGERGKLDKFVQ